MEENDDKIRIERILGVSVTGNSHFDSDSGLLAYPAGNSVVLLDVGSGTVVSHVVLETKKAISSLQLKGNSLLFVASDSSNFLRIVNWESGLVRDLAPCQNVICSAVSSSLGVIVTVSSDRVVSVWDYKSLMSPTSNGNTPTLRASTPGSSGNRGRKLASSSVASKVSSVTFSPDGLYFVTSGSRHLKFWYIQLGKNECVLTGRPAILGSEHNQADFRDVVTDGNGTYAIANFESTASATLCQFDHRRFLDKWVQLKTKEAFCICIDEDLLFIGCTEGLIRCFRAGKLDFITTLPLPHHLGVHIAGATDITSLSSHPPLSRFPHVVAISATGGKKVAAVYSDKSLYVWDFQDIRRVGLTHSYLNHSGCVWDISVGSIGSSPNSWPLVVSCSNDDTIRLWNITSQAKTNLYSNECMEILYISTKFLDSPLFISHGNGVRSVVIGSDFLSFGDRQGNLRLWGKKTKNEVIKIKAHNEEILAMDVKGNLLVTASRDATLNLYHISEEVDRIASLKEHSSSVTGVKLFFSDRSPLPQLVSCGADKMIILRQILPKGNIFQEEQRNFLSALAEGEFSDGLRVEVKATLSSKTPLFDLDVDSSGRHILVACQDSCVRVYNVSSGKQSKSLRIPGVVEGVMPTIIKIQLDPSGAYLAVSRTDKVITVFDYLKGEVIASLLGHSELATALSFTPDLQNLLSVGGDACIFVWNLSREMVVSMKARMAEKRSRVPPSVSPPLASVTKLIPPPKSPSPLLSSSSSSPQQRGPDYRFSFGQLPDWAKKQMTGDRSSVTKKAPVPMASGKWSERVDGPITIKSFHNADTIVFPPKSTPQEEPFELCDESLREILKKDEEPESSDFHSDLKSPTDGEDGGRSRGASETDENNAGSTSSKSTPHPFEINRSRNAELIMSVKLKRNEVSKSRLELEKRLDDTRKKLQSIGYKSMSQSTTDLSRTHYRALPITIATLTQMLKSHTPKYFPTEPLTSPTTKAVLRVSPSRIIRKAYEDEEALDAWEGSGEESGLRRACSLSDLNATPLPPSRRKRSFKKQRNRTRSNSSGVFDAQTLITRSISMSALMIGMEGGSDSDGESLPPQPSYMSKTISSQRKTRRKGQSQENLNRDETPRLRVSSSEQNLAKGMMRSKGSSTLTKAQPVYAVVTGVRQEGRDEDPPLSVETASASVDSLKKCLDQVLILRRRVSIENVRDREPIGRILDEGLLNAKSILHQSVLYTPKILLDREATDL